MLNDYDEIVLPTETDGEDVYSTDDLIIIPIEKYDCLLTEVGKLNALRSYLLIAKKPTFAAVEALLGISLDGRTND